MVFCRFVFNRLRHIARKIRPVPTACLCLCALIAAAPACSGAGRGFEHFVTARDGQLFDGAKPFRFISWNVPNLHYVEDNLAFDETNAFRWPDEFEVRDALAAVSQMGGQVVRIYVLSVRRTNDPPDKPCHVLGPGRFNEEGFRVLDMVLKVANEEGVRLIIPFVDNWSWWGGAAEYAGFRGKPKEAFWHDPAVMADFKETIRFVVTRTNTLTGTRYCEDKAILCWETGNELESPPAWTREIAAFIKSLDTNHLVMDGYNATVLRNESLEMPEVDIVTTHHYPGLRPSFARLIRQNAARAKARSKPYIVGEFGFVETPQMVAAMKAIMDSGAAGGLLWSLRFRNRDGGFYWHSEPAGGNRYKAFHWPGSPLGDAYDEIGLMRMARSYAFKIRGLAPPALCVPAPPRLIPPRAGVGITWQGSVGATHYIVERAPAAAGPWTVVATNVDECFVQYRPLFVDESARPGRWYYRVRAVNRSGVSEPSAPFGPVQVSGGIVVDEMADLRKAYKTSGVLELKTDNCRQAKEDAHRLAGRRGARIVYRVPNEISSFRIYAFHTDGAGGLSVRASQGGTGFAPIVCRKTAYYAGPGDYRYWVPVLYEPVQMPRGAKFLEIEFVGNVQIGRVEIMYASE
ncbi:MAG: cellulase family glycosylhydrolase [Verrucomicrobiales bacterium]|nr:cellulase family glycosylhydrolase [Verrucomicrobiales bacterium]